VSFFFDFSSLRVCEPEVRGEIKFLSSGAYSLPLQIKPLAGILLPMSRKMALTGIQIADRRSQIADRSIHLLNIIVSTT